MFVGQTMIETIEDNRNPHGGEVVESVSDLPNLVWVRREARYIARSNGGYAIAFEHSAGTGWYPESNARMLPNFS